MPEIPKVRRQRQKSPKSEVRGHPQLSRVQSQPVLDETVSQKVSKTKSKQNTHS